MAAADEYGGTRGAIYRASWELARGNVDELERLLDQLVQEDPETRYLYPVLVNLARQRGDLEGALAYLERLESEHTISEGRKVSTSIGSISERNALRAEKGSIHFDLGNEGKKLGAMWAPSTVYSQRHCAKYLEYEASPSPWPERDFNDMTNLEKQAMFARQGKLRGPLPDRT